MKTAWPQPDRHVRIGANPHVHAMSTIRPGETTCGLGGAFSPIPEDTKHPVSCPECLRIKSYRTKGAPR